MSAHNAAIDDEMTDRCYKLQLFQRLPPWIQEPPRKKRKLKEGEADSADMTGVQFGRQDLQRVLQD